MADESRTKGAAVLERFGVFLIPVVLALVVPSTNLRAEPGKLSPKELDALVGAVLKAHGGAEALRRVRSIKVEGRLRNAVRKGEGAGTVYFQRPDKLLSDNRFRASREIRILNGSDGWVNTGGAFRPAPPPVMLAMLYSLVSYELPLELADRRERLSYLGRVEQLGRRFDVVELDYSKALRVRVYVESESKRIAQVAGYIKMGEQTAILSRVLGDYREVDGVVYPFHQLYHSGSTLIAEKWVESVQVNPPLTEGKFSPE